MPWEFQSLGIIVNYTDCERSISFCKQKITSTTYISHKKL